MHNSVLQLIVIVVAALAALAAGFNISWLAAPVVFALSCAFLAWTTKENIQ